MTLMRVYSLSLLLWIASGRADVIARMRQHPVHALLIVPVHRCMRSALFVNIWLPCMCFSGTSSPSWDDADLNQIKKDWVPGAGRSEATGRTCKKARRVLMWRRWAGRTISARRRSEQMWNEIILHNGSGGGSGRKLQRQACDWKVSALKWNACSPV